MLLVNTISKWLQRAFELAYIECLKKYMEQFIGVGFIRKVFPKIRVSGQRRRNGNGPCVQGFHVSAVGVDSPRVAPPSVSPPDLKFRTLRPPLPLYDIPL